MNLPYCYLYVTLRIDLMNPYIIPVTYDISMNSIS